MLLDIPPEPVRKQNIDGALCHILSEAAKAQAFEGIQLDLPFKLHS